MSEEQKTNTVGTGTKPRRDWPPLLVGAVLLVGYLLVTSMLIRSGVPEGSATFITEMITTLRDAFMLFMMYLYGTNASSARKTELLSKSPPIKEE